MIPVYDVISGHTHLSLEGAQEFFQNGDAELRLSQQPRHNELMPCEDVCLGMQFDTMLAFNELLRTPAMDGPALGDRRGPRPARQAGGPGSDARPANRRPSRRSRPR
jgi:hypothetical protein